MFSLSFYLIKWVHPTFHNIVNIPPHIPKFYKFEKNSSYIKPEIFIMGVSLGRHCENAIFWHKFEMNVEGLVAVNC